MYMSLFYFRSFPPDPHSPAQETKSTEDATHNRVYSLKYTVWYLFFFRQITVHLLSQIIPKVTSFLSNLYSHSDSWFQFNSHWCAPESLSDPLTHFSSNLTVILYRNVFFNKVYKKISVTAGTKGTKGTTGAEDSRWFHHSDHTDCVRTLALYSVCLVMADRGSVPLHSVHSDSQPEKRIRSFNPRYGVYGVRWITRHFWEENVQSFSVTGNWNWNQF